jgi:hypothetical protein
MIEVFCWSACPPSQHDCLHILPSLSTHLCCPKSITATTTTNSSSGSSGSGSGGWPYALSLSSASIDSHTVFVLMAWHSFPPTLAEDREQYFGPRGTADVWLESEWDAGDDLEMERRALPDFGHETAEDIVWCHRTLAHHKLLATLMCSA